MSKIRAIKRRIKSAKSIEQITRGMMMVATAKYRRAQQRALKARPYFDALKQILEQHSDEGDFTHPMLTHGDPSRIGIVVVCADKGLCGSFNTNLVRTVQSFIRANPDKAFELLCVGKKGYDYFHRRHFTIHAHFHGLFQKLTFASSESVSASVYEFFIHGNLGACYIASNRFISAMAYRPLIEQALPVPKRVLGESGTDRSFASAYLYEPSPEELLGFLLPQYLKQLIWQTMMESEAAEHLARMAAMNMATKSTQEMISSLTILYNRGRQAGITSELADIVGGAEALSAK